MRKCYNKLRGKIIEVFGTQDNFAEALGISKQQLSRDLCGNSEFTISKMTKYMETLGISTKQVYKYFFDHELSNNQIAHGKDND